MVLRLKLEARSGSRDHRKYHPSVNKILSITGDQIDILLLEVFIIQHNSNTHLEEDFQFAMTEI